MQHPYSKEECFKSRLKGIDSVHWFFCQILDCFEPVEFIQTNSQSEQVMVSVCRQSATPCV